MAWLKILRIWETLLTRVRRLTVEMTRLVVQIVRGRTGRDGTRLESLVLLLILQNLLVLVRLDLVLQRLICRI